MEKVNRVIVLGMGFRFTEDTVRTLDGQHTDIKPIENKLTFSQQDEALADCLEQNPFFFRSTRRFVNGG